MLTDNIVCPNCKTTISIEEALYMQFAEELKEGDKEKKRLSKLITRFMLKLMYSILTNNRLILPDASMSLRELILESSSKYRSKKEILNMPFFKKK
jgi:hypothetical protein